MSSPATGQSYGRILKSSALLGGSSLVNVLLGMLRVKVLAVQLGPALFGVMSLYTSLTGMICSVVSLGIGQSAVREIAAAAGSGDEQRVARTVAILRRVVWLTGGLGLLVTIAVALPASWWTFGDHIHAWAIALLAVTVLFTQLQAGQGALLLGLRKVREVAMINLLGGVWSTLLAIPILLIFREQGIVPFLIAVAAGQLASSWWYARRVPLAAVRVSWSETLHGSREMLHLGLTLVVSGVAVTASGYLIRLILQHQIGEAAVGLYQSAFTISGLYVGFILEAMGGDYYPRLAAVGEDRLQRNQLVNEQAEMAILLAVPGLVAALVVSEVLIRLLYSDRFAGASDILRWQMLGLLGRIITWPLGYILLARADKRAFLFTELAAVGVHILLVWLAVQAFGAVGAGIAFAGQYLFYLFLITAVIRMRHGFSWHAQGRRLVAYGALLVMVAFVSTYIGSTIWRYLAGGLLMLITLAWSLQGFIQRLGRERLLAALRGLAQRVGWVRAEVTHE